MTIFRTAHDTRLVSGENTEKPSHACIDMQVLDGRLTDNLYRLSKNPNIGGDLTFENREIDTIKIGLVTPLTLAEQQLSPLFHPIEVVVPKLGLYPSHSVLVGDVRPFIKMVDKRSIQVVNAMELEFMKVRLALGAHWLKNGPRDIYHLSTSLVKIYSSWLANNITRRFALDMQEQMQTRIIAAHFFQCLHSERDEIDQEDKRATAAVLARNLNVKVNDVEAVIEYAGVITGIEDFVGKLKGWVKTPRLDSFNLGIFTTIMAGSWFGIGGSQAAVVALEHPPTFAAMTYIAFDQRGFRRASFADMVTKSFKGTGGEIEILRSVKRICDMWV